MTIDTKAIKARLEKATKGPWFKRPSVRIGEQEYPPWEVQVGDCTDRFIPISGSGGAMSYSKAVVRFHGTDHDEANADFIAHAPEDIAALLDAYETSQAEVREKTRICRALGHYAAHAPLDLKSKREIQNDLFAICGTPHVHVASIGTDACDLCGRDLRHSVHVRRGIGQRAKEQDDGH